MRSISAKVWRSRCADPSGRCTPGNERSTRSRARACDSAAAARVCCKALEALLDVRAQLVELLPDNSF